MRLILILCCIVATQVGSLVSATSVPDAATVENVAGAWRAVGPNGSHYRLILDTRGRGQLGIAIHAQELLFEIESVEYDGNSVRMRLEKKKWSLMGEAYPSQYLKLSGKGIWGDDALRFYPEAEWRDAEERLSSVMRAPGK